LNVIFIKCKLPQTIVDGLCCGLKLTLEYFEAAIVSLLTTQQWRDCLFLCVAVSDSWSLARAAFDIATRPFHAWLSAKKGDFFRRSMIAAAAWAPSTRLRSANRLIESGWSGHALLGRLRRARSLAASLLDSLLCDERSCNDDDDLSTWVSDARAPHTPTDRHSGHAR